MCGCGGGGGGGGGVVGGGGGEDMWVKWCLCVIEGVMGYSIIGCMCGWMRGCG